MALPDKYRTDKAERKRRYESNIEAKRERQRKEFLAKERVTWLKKTAFFCGLTYVMYWLTGNTGFLWVGGVFIAIGVMSLIFTIDL